MTPRSNESISPSAMSRQGVIVAHYGVAVEVSFADGERASIRVKRRSGHVIGDDVVVHGEVLQRLPRRTELRRRDAGGNILLLAANLDRLGIVVAPLPAPPPHFIDRAIVAARAAALHPFIVANKIDLESEQFLCSLRSLYLPQLEIFAVSTHDGRGLDALQSYFQDGTRGAFVGTSGVGKSSLLNALSPISDLRIGELNDYNQKGCHTTTVSTLHRLPQGGELVDTPGFQDFGLVDITVHDLCASFPGFEAVEVNTCRFRDCRHRSEPGCAVVAAVKDGLIAEGRYKAYLDLLAEVELCAAEERQRNWRS